MDITSAIFSKEILSSKLFFVLLDRHVFFFLHQMEERKEEDEGGVIGCQALAMQESGSCDALVVVMDLLRYIRRHNMVSLSRVVGRTLVLVPTGSDDLALGCLSF